MKRRTFLTLLAAGPVAACAGPAHATLRGLTMGTSYTVELAASIDDALRARLTTLIEAELAAINRSMSTYDAQSELARFNTRQDSAWQSASRGLLEVLDSASRISLSSDGAFDVTVGPLVDLWGFGPQVRARHVPGDEAIRRVRERIGHRHLQVDLTAGAIRKRHPGTQVDLSAIAKGYGVDRIATVLDRQGVRDYLVEIGGELRARGAVAGRPWRVGIERPIEGRRVVGETVVLRDHAIATSGTTQDFFEEQGRHYSHIIDPVTAAPVQHPAMAASVIAETTMEADAWATAMIVLGPQRGYALAQAHKLAVLFVTASGSNFDVRVTDAFRGHLAA